MLSIPNNIIVKDRINKQIVDIFKEINDINIKTFYDKLTDIFTRFCEQYEDGEDIDVVGINKILESMHDSIIN